MWFNCTILRRHFQHTFSNPETCIEWHLEKCSCISACHSQAYSSLRCKILFLHTVIGWVWGTESYWVTGHFIAMAFPMSRPLLSAGVCSKRGFVDWCRESVSDIHSCWSKVFIFICKWASEHLAIREGRKSKQEGCFNEIIYTAQLIYNETLDLGVRLSSSGYKGLCLLL